MRYDSLNFENFTGLKWGPPSDFGCCFVNSAIQFKLQIGCLK